MKTGVELIAEERQEQLGKHGKTADHDDQLYNGELTDAAVICATESLVYYSKKHANGITFEVLRMDDWNLPVKYYGNVLLNNNKSSTEERIHQLKVAGALIAAEIDRIQRIK